MSMCESILTIALVCTVKYLHYCDYYYTLGNDSQSTPKLIAYFIATVDESDRYFVMFEILFWTGCREGELLALTKKEIDLENNQIHITKTYFRSGGKDIITTPKTDCSVRVIDIPEFLKVEIDDYIGRLYKYPDDARIFPMVAEALQHKIKRHIAKAGVKMIRIHDLRHPYVKPTTKNIYLYTRFRFENASRSLAFSGLLALSLI